MRSISRIVAAVLVVLTLTGCAGQAEETATPEAAAALASVISATGEVMPAKWANLSIQTGGTIIQVEVERGDEVAEENLLVKLDPADAQLAVQQAEAAMETAQAQLALLQAPPRPEEIAAADAQVQTSQAALSQATAQRNQVTSGATEAEIAAAQVEVAQAEAARTSAQFQYDQVRNEKATKDWVKEEAALRLRAAEQTLEAAQRQLSQLQAGAGARTREADAAVSAAGADQNVAQAQLDLLKAGATAEGIAVAQAGVDRAQVELDAARVTLERCELRAPFAGTVGAIDVRVGELVAPGDPVVTIGDLSTLRVETTDLDEIDVARVKVGQKVTLAFDALPEQDFAGRVTRIDPMAQPGTGGVNYRVLIEIDEIAPAIRWGMTAFVDIEVEG